MKRNIFSAILMSCLLLVSSATLTSCGEDLQDTNQYQGAVSLNVYGPIPVMRGGTLRFLGSNLDDGCQDGAITLTAKDGTEILTKTPISYIEGLNKSNITIPAAAFPGDKIRITVPEDGDDYLDIIHMVEFEKGVKVGEASFTEHSRYVIELVVPEEAQTGKLNLYTADLTIAEVAESNTDYQIITTEDAIEIGTPSTSKVTSPRGDAVDGVVTAKQGEAITLTGSYYNLVKSIKIGEVEITEITKKDNTISFVVPAEAADETILLVCSSGVELPVATLATIAPTNLAVAPSPVKAGAALTITGQDMDVVTAVEFPNGGKLEGDNITVAADKVTVKEVPSKATDDASLKLYMANGKTVEVAYKLVVPTVAAYDKNPIEAGAKIQITGTDLDLVKSIKFGAGEATLDAAKDISADGTTIIVTIPMEATSGKPQFLLDNGVSVEGGELTINEAVFCYITELPTDETKPDAGGVVTVPVKNGDKLTKVMVDGKEVSFVYDEKNSSITFGIPVATGSTAKVKLISSNGEIEYSMPVKPATEVEKVVFVGPVSIDWSANRVYVEPADIEGVPETAVMHIEFTQHDAWGQVQINYGDWKQIMFEGTESGYIKTGTLNDNLPLTAEILANIKAKAGSHAIIIQGQEWTINKISFKWENVMEKDLASYVQNMDGTPVSYPYTLTWGNDGRFKLPKDLLLNDIKVKKGSIFRVYKTAGSTGQVQINNNSWTAIDYLKDWNGDVELMEKEFDDAMMEAVEGGGLVIQGGLSGITKIAILP